MPILKFPKIFVVSIARKEIVHFARYPNLVLLKVLHSKCSTPFYCRFFNCKFL